MGLRYDHQTGRYIGTRLSIPEWVFVNRLQELLLAGDEPNDALERLLDESVWSAKMPGVATLAPNLVCRHCGSRLPQGRQIFCDVLCEAASYVDSCLYSAPGD